MNLIYKSSKVIKTEHAVEVNPEYCFLYAKNNRCNSGFDKYFAQFKREQEGIKASYYTIQFYEENFTHYIEFKANDLCNHLPIKSIFENYREVKIISEKEFFEEYNNHLLKVLQFQKVMKWGTAKDNFMNDYIDV